MPEGLVTSTEETRSFPARLGALPDTAAFVRSFCDRLGVARQDALRLTLVVEELLANTIGHGYGRESDAPVSVTLSLQDRRVALLYEDAAPPYNPLDKIDDARGEATDTVEARPVGGLGLSLVFGFMRNPRYARENDRNRLWLELASRG